MGMTHGALWQQPLAEPGHEEAQPNRPADLHPNIRVLSLWPLPKRFPQPTTSLGADLTRSRLISSGPASAPRVDVPKKTSRTWSCQMSSAMPSMKPEITTFGTTLPPAHQSIVESRPFVALVRTAARGWAWRLERTR